MPNERHRSNLLQMDVDNLLKPFDDERKYLEQLRQSTTVESILLHLFDLLQIEDYHLLFSTINFQTIDLQWLESFSRICMKRYLEFDDICFTSKTLEINFENKNDTKSIIENYTNFLIENLKQRFTLKYFCAIIIELEELNHFKFEQISKQLNENNHIIHDIFLSFNNDNDDKDDSIIHISSTPAQTINRPVYINYKPMHMVYLRENLLIKNDLDLRLPLKGITNTFIADLIHTKIINILDETTGKTYDIPTKWLYFSKPCESNVILPLKLRVLIIDSQTGIRRYGFISEEPGKNNDYRCLIFFTDDKTNMSANYHPSSHIYICLDQTFSIHTHECQNDYLDRYFSSYPERMMLRAKEGSFVKVRNIFTNYNHNLFIHALVIQIDGSMMQIELTHSKQRIWLYRGSPLLDQMHNYYSTQNKAAINGFARRTARQHLSARRTNAPEIICLNDQTTTTTTSPSTVTSNTITTTNKGKFVRTAEQAIDGIDETRSIKRPRIFSEQDPRKASSLQSTTSIQTGLRTLRPRQSNNSTSNTLPTSSSSSSLNNDHSSSINLHRQSSTPSISSSHGITTTMQLRSSHTNINTKVVMNPLFLELSEKFLLHYSYEFHPHNCSHKCVVYAEKHFHQLPRTMNPFLKPFACHWTMLDNLRVRKAGDVRLKATRSTFIYCAPCGRKLLTQAQVDNYLHETKSKLTIELFIYDSKVNVKQHYCPDGKILNSDISSGQENIPISVVNEVDREPAKIEEPSAFTYRVERTPVVGVNMVTNEPTMTCCTCTDGCRNRVQCACWLRTLKYAELIGDERVRTMKAKHKSQGEILHQLGYRYRRLLKNVPGGIYECNSRCSCNKQTCSNRVVQNGIIAQLQLFKTVGRGWGVRTLHDLPIGTFISVYSGEIFTSEQADERGKLLGDEYQADLDFFENINNDSEEEQNSGHLEQDDEEEDVSDTSPSSTESASTRLRNANLQSRARELLKKDGKKSSKTISEDNDNNSTLNRTVLPDYDGVVYTLDAKLVGNIGRYFNHSCSPNIAVQNVFVDTHDIHFPWIGFFATKTIRSGTELCWDYNYTVGEIAGRRMDCHCGAAECRRRVL
ncbi:unnamed protein product [Rotaria sordida]|uniref:Uncharacterized protein n=1 Tax=Rotaria sordida TaxID=392033 RepID=A0A818VR78_9BILA|nr:unnamed protein product [Rotaria sordida]CAF1247827.1 unnamed protein product [Rotaria sordida]CAF3638150.1 unnamed protein product [Rotaria sordida]CAF3714723.1 unnamed protein product [Rotaria sordida]